MTKQLLCDGFNPIRLKIQESADGRLVATGRFGFCGESTANGRVYPRELMEREITRLNERMGARALYGELDHPDDGKTLLKRVSHIITDLRVESNGEVIGELEVLEGTQNGRQLKELVESGVTLGVSSRGLGSVKKVNGRQVVQEDFKLLTYDVVADPAVSTAQPNYTRESEDDFGSVTSVLAAESSSSSNIDSKDKEMSLEDLKRDNPELIEQIEKELKESTEGEFTSDDVVALVSEQVQQATERLESKFADRLEQSIAEAKAEERAAVLSEMEDKESDDDSDDDSDGDDDSEEKSESVEQLARQDARISQLEEALLETGMAYVLFEHIHRVPEKHRDHFIEMVGNEDGFNTVTEFEQRVQTVTEEFDQTGRMLPTCEESYRNFRAKKRKLEESEAAVEELQTRVEGIRAKVAERNEVLAEAADEIKALRGRNEFLEEREDNLVEALHDARDAIVEERQRADAIEVELSEELEDAEEDLAYLESVVESSERKLRKAAKQLKENRRVQSALQKRLEESELDAYRAESVLGSAKPNSVKKQLREAKSKEEIDNRMSEHRERPRQKQTPPTKHTSNTGKDVLFENEVASRIMSIAQGDSQVDKSAFDQLGGPITENTQKKLDSEKVQTENNNRKGQVPTGTARIPGLDPSKAKSIMNGQ